MRGCVGHVGFTSTTSYYDSLPRKLSSKPQTLWGERPSGCNSMYCQMCHRTSFLKVAPEAQHLQHWYATLPAHRMKSSAISPISRLS